MVCRMQGFSTSLDVQHTLFIYVLIKG